MKRLLSIRTTACLLCSSLPALGGKVATPGLIARYDDGAKQAVAIVALPELGLEAGESSHPAIQPAFDASFQGILRIQRHDTYTFDYPGSITINGKFVSTPIELQPGEHQLSLEYKRKEGAISIGLFWESGHFIKEPVPPDVLGHRGKTPSITPTKGPYPSPPIRIQQSIETMKCASCHDANFLNTLHHRFAPDALMSHIRHTNTVKWHGATTGPPFQESDALKRLVEDIRKLPGPTRHHQPGKAQAKGLKMIGTHGGYGCIACHDLLHHHTTAESKGPNLATLDDRISYDWFVRWMSDPQRHKPGVPMPAFFAAQTPAERQANIDALWDYILEADKMPVPGELQSEPDPFILKPTDKAMVNRVYLRLPDQREMLRAICVGLPNGTSYCFDAETCRLAYVWQGGYLDMTDHWKGQSLHPVAILGETVMLLAPDEGIGIGEVEARFRGYEWVQGLPRFEFAFGDTLVRLSIASPAAGEIRQTFTVVDGSAKPIRFTGPITNNPVSATASAGIWKGRLLELEAKEQTTLTINLRRKQP